MRSAQFKYIVYSLLLILASISVTKTTISIMQSTHRLEELKEDVSQLESKKAELNTSIEYKNTNSYVEEKARNDLNMVLPDEKLFVIVGDNVLGKSTSAKIVAEAPVITKDSNIYQWYRVFF